MDNGNTKRSSLRAALIGTALFVLLGGAAFLWPDGMGALAPLAAGAGTAALWALLVRFCLEKQDKYLAPGFRVPVRNSVCLPVWLGLTFALLAGVMATHPANTDETAFWLVALFLLCAMAAVPAAALGLGVHGLIVGIRHLRQTAAAEGRLCRELPVALPAFLLAALAACGIVAAVSLLG